MHTTSEQAAIEVRIDREINGVRHRVRQHLEKLNFWRDILPGTLTLKLPASTGDRISETFTAGELVPPWSAANIHTVKRTALRLVPHLDTTASEQIRELYGRALQPGMQVLDLMSSWVSHLPDIDGLADTGWA